MAAAAPVLSEALDRCRRGFCLLLVLSCGINLLMLTAPLFMLQLFDRVVTSRSTDTLIFLTAIAGAALLAMALLEMVRGDVLTRIGGWLEQTLSAPILRRSLGAAQAAGPAGSIQGLRDLQSLRGFLGGASILPLLDTPWTPLFLMVIFLLHPLLGWMALGGAFGLIILALANEALVRNPQSRASQGTIDGLQHAQAMLRNAEVIKAMGMEPRLIDAWNDRHRSIVAWQTKAGQRGAVMAAIAKGTRLALQIAILAMGAWLVIGGELTPGAMIASSILLSRALAPVDQAIGFWKSFTAARGSYRRLQHVLAQEFAAECWETAMSLPAPRGVLTAEAVGYTHPCADARTINAVSFDLEPGEMLGVVGSTAAGKSTLARLLIGNIAPDVGHVRLDGVDMTSWSAADRARHVGYLPQDIEMFGGTVKANIARLGDPDPDLVVEAARLAGIHEMVLHLPDGYETELGEQGATLSGGQRQRLALARALYGTPRFIVLDEPNASLDGEGEAALLQALDAMRAKDSTIVLITHRPNVLRVVDKILVIRAATVGLFGQRDEVWRQIAGHQTRPAVAEGGRR